MDVWQITVAALRRWYILLPLLALTGFGAFAVGEGVAPQYEVRATGILMPGSEPSEIASPYGSLDGTATVLGIVLDDPAVRERISALDLQSDYNFRPQNRSRIIDVNVLSDSPERSLATADAVIELANQELAERQAEVGIPANAQVELQVLRAPAVTDVVSEGKMRNMVVVGIGGAALSLLVAVLFDDLAGLLRRWRRRRTERRKRHAEAEEPGRRRRRAAAVDGEDAVSPVTDADDVTRRDVSVEVSRGKATEAPDDTDSDVTTQDTPEEAPTRRLVRTSRES